MGLTASGQAWDDASSPAAIGLARRFEAAWRGGVRPDPGDYLPRDPACRPGALLAILRADLTLRFEAGEPARVEEYVARHSDLSPEAVVALLYEEFCQREEAGEVPEAEEYYARFPELAAPLGRVLGIHELVGSGESAGLPSSEVPLPEAGQTIAGFHLVEELGRGAFARVFLARERQLADRPVALKVARRGSREPQALARLQHTHIVPIHSYRVDPATELHLLCMPYLGRVTLAQVLADPAAAVVRTGSELVGIVDRLAPDGDSGGDGPGRRELGCRPFARAVAWWGARLAEALQHAHERGILHRDVKPSNVLIAGDGLPMLLDFNLAHGPIDESAADAVLTAPGGTLAYMAPEHLEALASGDSEGVDARCDVYALGVVLYEVLASARPFAQPTGALSVEDALRRAIQDRRAGAEPLRRAHPEVPPALEAVVRRCLAPDPADRYASASELAADLHAVADDGPLCFAREPQPGRALRWLRRRRRALAAVGLALTTMAIIGASLHVAREAQFARAYQFERLYEAGEVSTGKEQFASAAAQFEAASKFAEGQPDLRDRYEKARARRLRALETAEVRARAKVLLDRADPLHFHLLGFGGEPGGVAGELREALAPFYVLANPAWYRLPALSLLDRSTRMKLEDEVDELLFLWARSTDAHGRPETIREGLEVCDRALSFTRTPGPWRTLKARLAGRLGVTAPPPVAERPEAESSARACLKWGLLNDMAGRSGGAMAWLERAVQLEPGDYWSRFALAWHCHQAGRIEEALRHCEVAVALVPDSPWARLNHARLLEERGSWAGALDDLNRALEAARAQHFDFARARLELGLVKQRLGDVVGARSAYDSVIASEKGGPYARAARLDRARLDFEAGDLAAARAGYNELLAGDLADEAALAARLGRAILAVRAGQPSVADGELTRLLVDLDARRESRGLRAEALALRAATRLHLGCSGPALADAEAAYHLRAGLASRRLVDRSRLAAGRPPLLRLDDPSEVDRWPVRGPRLTADLRAAADRLRPAPGDRDTAQLDRAVLLSASGNHASAEIEASRALKGFPDSAQARLVRARVRRRAGDRRRAMADVDQGLRLGPDSARLLELRALLRVEAGDPAAALDDLDRAASAGAEATVWAVRARALAALGRDEAAVSAWTSALSHDPDDPRLALGRARSLTRLGLQDAALADLEHAAGWTEGEFGLRARIVLAYAVLLPDRPDRLPRVLALGRLTLATRPTSLRAVVLLGERAARRVIGFLEL